MASDVCMFSSVIGQVYSPVHGLVQVAGSSIVNRYFKRSTVYARETFDHVQVFGRSAKPRLDR